MIIRENANQSLQEESKTRERRRHAKNLKKGILVSLAVSVLLIVLFINALEVVPTEYRYRFEEISNVIMIILAVVGLLCFHNKRTTNRNEVFYILSNMAVTLLALIMNVYVFDQTIRLNHLCEDVCEAYLLWVVIFVLQATLLTGLGRGLLNVMSSLCNVINSTVKQLYETICTLVKRSDDYVVCSIALMFLGWAIYVGIEIYNLGFNCVFGDVDIIFKSMWFWMAGLIICLFIRIFPLSIQKAGEGIKELKGKTMLILISVIGLVVLLCTVNGFLTVVTSLILIPLLAMRVLYLYKKPSQRMNESESNNANAVKPKNNESKNRNEINQKDLEIVLLAFLLPTVLVLVIACLQPEALAVWEDHDSLKIDVLIKYVEKVLDIVPLFLKLID
jgi:hypothetical protein